MNKQRTAALPLATLAAATALAALLPASANAAAARSTLKPAASAGCSVQIQRYTQPGGTNVDVLAVTNTGLPLAGWNITISTSTQIGFAAASEGTWSNVAPNEVIGSGRDTIATGGVIHAAIEGYGLGAQPYVNMSGTVCTS